MSHQVFRLLITAVFMTTLCVGTALAFSVNALVGQWFTEIDEKKTYLGEPYTIRKQIEDNRPDGTKTATFRFYDNCRYIGELINELQWGVDANGTYWTKCQSITQAGQVHPCDVTRYYDLTEVTASQVKYRSRETNTLYTMQKVEAGFKIPPSACVSSAKPPKPIMLR